MRLPLPALAIPFLFASPLLAEAQELPSPFADEEARRLVEGAIYHRGVFQGEEVTHGLVESRIRAGILIPNQWNWRYRTLFHKETLGLVSYSGQALREDTVLARSRGAPVVGDRLMDRPPLWNFFGFDPEESDPALLALMGLSLASIAPDLPLGETPGVVKVFDSSFVDPLGPLGPSTYRYSMDQDLEIPGEGPHVLLGVVFRPLDREKGQLTGIVWFDGKTEEPVRAMIRPRGQWQLSAGLRGWVRKVPLLPKDAFGEIEYLTLEYVKEGEGLFFPDAAHLHGAMSMFFDQAVLPVQMEWELGWTGEIPTIPDPEAPEPLAGGWRFSEEHRELNPFLRELDRVVGPPPAPRVGQVATKTISSVRFNQVQGVNFTVPYSHPLGARTRLNAEVGIPTSSFKVTGSLGLELDRYPLRWGMDAYSHLKDANWMEGTNGFTSSITALLTGYDDGQYYLASGGSVWMEYGDRPLRGSLSLFAEDQRKAEKVATYSLLEPDTMETLPAEFEIDSGTYYGVRSRVDLQLGHDPQRGVLLARIYGQAAVGEKSLVSLGTTTDLVGPLPGPFTGAVRVQAGIANEDAPGQALYYLAGYKTIRGYPANIASGPSVLILTGEIGTEVPLARLVAFGDLGWAGTTGSLFSQDALTAVGAGVSLGDGILRIDVAKGLSDGGVWRFYFATSGLF